jgi:hypothetical protein
VEVFEHQPTCRQRINIGGFNDRMASRAQPIRTKLICHNIEKIRAVGHKGDSSIYSARIKLCRVPLRIASMLRQANA